VQHVPRLPCKIFNTKLLWFPQVAIKFLFELNKWIYTSAISIALNINTIQTGSITATNINCRIFRAILFCTARLLRSDCMERTTRRMHFWISFFFLIRIILLFLLLQTAFSIYFPLLLLLLLKVKLALEQAMKAYRGSTSIALLFL
jgi:hypothetical protein